MAFCRSLESRPEGERRKAIVIVRLLCAKDCYLISEQILPSLLTKRRFVLGWTKARAITCYLFSTTCLKPSTGL